MSADVIESQTFTPTVTVPVAGEAVTAASILAPVQAVTNRTAYLKERVEGSFTDFAIPLGLWQNTGELSEFRLESSSWVASEASASHNNGLTIPIKCVAPNGKLTSITLRYQTDNEYVNGDAVLQVCSRDYLGAVTVEETVALIKRTSTGDTTLAVSPALSLKGAADVFAVVATNDFGGTKTIRTFSLRTTGTPAD